MALFIAVGLVTARLAQNAQRLRALATTDDLTGLHNLRSFEAHLAPMVRTARIAATPVSLLVLDVDRLKSLNDRYGHLAGSDAVREVGRIIAETVPPRRFPVATVAMNSSSPCRAATRRKRMRLPAPSAIASTRARRLLPESRFPPALSRSASAWHPATCFGVVRRTRAGDDEAGEALFLAADTALYAAKRNGRNYVAVA